MKATQKAAILSLCTLMVVSAIAVPATAYSGGTTAVQFDGDPYIVINLGVIGDHVLDCGDFDVDLGGNYGASVGVDPTSSGAFSYVGANVLVPENTLPESSRICIGGASGPTGPVPAGATNWQVAAQDYLVNGCVGTRLAAGNIFDGALGTTANGAIATATGPACSTLGGGVDGLLTAVSMGAAYTARAQVTVLIPFSGFVAPDCGTAEPSVCFGDAEDYEVFHNTLKMGVCGASNTAMHAGDLDASGSGGADSVLPAGTYNTNTATWDTDAEAQLFAAGPLFYATNCLGAVGQDIQNAYDVVGGIINGVICTPTPPLIPLACLFPFPGRLEACSPATSGALSTSAVPFPMIVGEMAWGFGTTGCTQTHEDDPWQFFGADDALIVIDDGTIVAGVLSTVNSTVDVQVCLLDTEPGITLGTDNACPGSLI